MRSQTTQVTAHEVWGHSPTWPISELTSGGWPQASQTLQIVPTLPTVLPLDTQALERHTQTIEKTRDNQLPVRFLGYAALFEGTRLYQGGATDWALMSLGEDPHYVSEQKLYLPQTAKEDMHAIIRSGLNFEAIYIAHELPQGLYTRASEIPPEAIMPPPPQRLARSQKAFVKTLSHFWQGVEVGVKTVFKIGALTAAGIVAVPVVASGALGALGGLDPILFGVQPTEMKTTTGERIGMWYYLTHWNWPEGEVQ